MTTNVPRNNLPVPVPILVAGTYGGTPMGVLPLGATLGGPVLGSATYVGTPRGTSASTR